MTAQYVDDAINQIMGEISTLGTRATAAETQNAALAAQLATVTTARDAALAAKTTDDTAIAALAAQLATVTTARDAALAAKTTDDTAIAALNAQIATLNGQIAVLQANEGVVVTTGIYAAMGAGEVLIELTPPDGNGGWALQAVGVTPSQVIVGASAILRGSARLTQGTLRTVSVRWVNGSDQRAPFSLVFKDEDTSPAPRAWDIGPPVVAVADVYQVFGQDHVDIPVAFLDGDGHPYPLSRHCSVECNNGGTLGYSTDGTGFLGPVGPTDLVYHPHHNTRGMVRIAIGTAAIGYFIVRFFDIGEAPQTGNTERYINVHLVASEEELPAGYVKPVYEDDQAVGVPAWPAPSGTPAYDDDLLGPMTFEHYTVQENVTTDAWFMEEFALNYMNGVFAVPGTTVTKSGRVITADELFPIKTLPDGRHVRALQYVDCRGDQVVDRGSQQNYYGDYAAPSLRRRILPIYGHLMIHVTPPTNGAGDDRAMGVDFAIWYYMNVAGVNGYGRERDLSESFPNKNAFDSTCHDVANSHVYSVLASGTHYAEHIRYWTFTTTTMYAWMSDPSGGNMTLLYQIPNFFPDIDWPFLNFLLEGPGSGASGPADPNFDYSTTFALLHRITSYEDAGPDLAAPAPVFTRQPAIAGMMRVGRTVTAAPGFVQHGYPRGGQWQRDGIGIAGATSPTYIVDAADIGHALSWRDDAVGNTPATATTVVQATSPAGAPVLAADAAPAGGYSAEATALFARMTTQPSGYEKAVIDELIVALKNEGVWAKLAGFVPMIGATQDQSLLNWISAQHAPTLVAGGGQSPAFTARQGFAFHGSDYIDLGFDPSIDGAALWTLGSASLGVLLLGPAAENQVQIGADGGGHSYIAARYDANNSLLTAINGGDSSFTNPAASANGLYVASRTSADSFVLYRNGVGVLPGVGGAATALPTGTLKVGKGSTKTTGLALYGAGLTAADSLALYHAFKTYRAAIGAA